MDMNIDILLLQPIIPIYRYSQILHYVMLKYRFPLLLYNTIKITIWRHYLAEVSAIIMGR